MFENLFINYIAFACLVALLIIGAFQVVLIIGAFHFVWKSNNAEEPKEIPIEIGSRWISKDSGSPFQRDTVVRVLKKQDGWLLLESPDWPKGWTSDVREDSFRRCYYQVEDFQP